MSLLYPEKLMFELGYRNIEKLFRGLPATRDGYLDAVGRLTNPEDLSMVVERLNARGTVPDQAAVFERLMWLLDPLLTDADSAARELVSIWRELLRRDPTATESELDALKARYRELSDLMFEDQTRAKYTFRAVQCAGSVCLNTFAQSVATVRLVDRGKPFNRDSILAESVAVGVNYRIGTIVAEAMERLSEMVAKNLSSSARSAYTPLPSEIGRAHV